MTNTPDIETIRSEHAKLMEALRRRIWPPMSYMMIPSVLKSADAFVASWSDDAGPHADELHRMAIEVHNARRDFRREG